MTSLVASDRAPGLHVAPDVVIPRDAEIAPHVTVYGGVRFGARVVLDQGAIVGRPQRIDARSRSPRRLGDATTLGDGCRVGSSTVVAAGAAIGDGTYLGDHVLIRETAVLGREVMVGRGSSIGVGTRTGDRTRFQNGVLMAPGTVIEEDVLVGPLVTFVGDATMGRRAVPAPPAGVRVRRACRIGTAAIIVPPAEIGVEAVVGAGALVRGEVRARTVVAGTPAQELRAVRDDELLERWRDPE